MVQALSLVYTLHRHPLDTYYEMIPPLVPTVDRNNTSILPRRKRRRIWLAEQLVDVSRRLAADGFSSGPSRHNQGKLAA